MIKIKLNNYEELLALYRFTVNNIDHLPEVNLLYTGIIKSLLEEMTKKLRNKLEGDSSRYTLSMKLHEALAFYTMYMDTVLPKPNRTNYEYNIVVMKMNEIHQKTVSKTYKNVLNPSQNVTETFQNGF